uniref:Reverse transcriptase domain-containing protein n=1 Tax=Panagrolaimus superbus TaxID=310955 RepID=A0A914Z1A1_9BILA
MEVSYQYRTRLEKKYADLQRSSLNTQYAQAPCAGFRETENFQNLITVLGNADVTLNEQRLMALGPKFAPATRSVTANHHSLDISFQLMADSTRRIFINPKASSVTAALPPPPFPASHVQFTPPIPTIEVRLASLKTSIFKCFDKYASSTTDNLAPPLRQALISLIAKRKTNELRISTSDKGGEFVVIPTSLDQQIVRHHLSDSSLYQPTTTENYESAAKTIETKWKNLCKQRAIPSKMKTSFLTTHPTPPVLYTLIKTHKLNVTNSAQPKDYKIRPIISQCSGPTDKIGWLLTRILSPLLKFVPAHLTNTNDLIQRIKEIDMSQVGAFASFDVEGLYTNVDNPSAIDATMEMLIEHLDQINLQGFLPEDIYSLLIVILDANIFRWSNKFFKQLRGLAMGLRLAPLLAIIFLNKLELRALSTMFYKLYGRYIDDTLVLATNNNQLNLIFDNLNKAHPQIKFTREDPTAFGLPYLNTKINISSNKLQLEWYRKPTCKNHILHANSAHPNHMKDNVVKSLRKTALQICNTIKARNEAEILVNNIAKQNGYIGSRFADQRGLGRYRKHTAIFKYIN